MSKNIIICSDGTGNSAIKDCGTNVFKLFEAVDLNGHRTDLSLDPQIALYDDGVGTESFRPLKILGGAFGWGLTRNVRDLYKGLVRVYDPGDRIYMFGFSRGAFTIRTLAGLVATCGIVDWRRLATTDALKAAVKAAYSTYRKGYRTWVWRVLHGKSVDDVKALSARATSDFREREQAHDADITFVGVWDTVDSVGGPFRISDVINTLVYRFKFSDNALSGKVLHAAQALSIDDARAAFEPVLWKAHPRIDQVWFAGVHANVGGGYPKQGMSLVTLDWMVQKACDNGLRINHDDRKRIAGHCSVDDKLYDSRAGVGVFYQWKPRNMRELSSVQHAGSPARVHVSVFERIAHGTEGYAPGTLAPVIDVAYTPTHDPERDRASQLRCAAVCSVLVATEQKREAELSKVHNTLVLGQIAYSVYLASCVATIFAAAVPPHTGSRMNPWLDIKSAGKLIWAGATGQWKHIFEAAQRLVTDPKLVILLASGFIIAAALASYVDQTRSRAFSRFWHSTRQDLRDALKSMRKTDA